MAKKMYIGVDDKARKVKDIYVGVYRDKETTPSGMPSGYTELEYIQSSGTQWINTGVTSKSSVTIEFKLQKVGDRGKDPFMETYTVSTNMVTPWMMSGGYFKAGRGSYTNIIASDNAVHEVVFGQSTIKVDGKEYAISGSASNDCVYGLFAEVCGTAPCAYGAYKLFYCRFYDNGALIRDFIPCKNASGAVGLYDTVNKVFYPNAGTGVFTAGTTIPNLPVGDYARKVKKGYVGVNGVARQFFAGGAPASTLPVGTIIKMNVNGTLKDFIVVHQGNPDASIYDSSCDGVWVMMKDIYEKRAMGTRKYAESAIHTNLNGTFFNQLDAKVRNSIKQVKIPYHSKIDGDSDNWGNHVSIGSDGLSTKVFIPSVCEVYMKLNPNSSDAYPHDNSDGSLLDYFANMPITQSYYKKDAIAYYNGTATMWSYRTMRDGMNYNGICTDVGYAWGTTPVTTAQGIRPMFILDNNTQVPDNLILV